MKCDELAIVVDTRERDPFLFSELAMRARLIRRKLHEGDYSVHGLTGRVCVERKAVTDLITSMTVGRGRFLRELDRLRRYDCAALVVEGTETAVMAGSPYSRVSGPSLVRSVYRECLLRNIVPVFSHSRYTAEWTTYCLLRGFRDAHSLKRK